MRTDGREVRERCVGQPLSKNRKWGESKWGKVDIHIFKKYAILEALTENMQPTESFNLLVVHIEITSLSKCSCV